MSRQEGDEDEAPALGFDEVPTHHGLRGVVPALHEHIRPESLDQLQRRVLVKAHHGVHAAQTQQHGRPGGLVLQGAPWPLQARHGGIAVQPHHQEVALGAGVCQILHVAGVDEVEAPVGEAQRPRAGDGREEGFRGLEEKGR